MKFLHQFVKSVTFGLHFQQASLQTGGAPSAGVCGSGMSHYAKLLMVSAGGPTADRLCQQQQDSVCGDLWPCDDGARRNFAVSCELWRRKQAGDNLSAALLWVHTHTGTHTHAQEHTHTHTHTNTHTNTHTGTHTHAQEHTHADTHTHRNTHTQTQ